MENVSITGVPATQRSGATQDRDWLVGGVAAVALRYRLGHQTSLQLGLQYQYLGTTRQSVNGKTARIDLGQALSVSIGAAWRF